MAWLPVSYLIATYESTFVTVYRAYVGEIDFEIRAKTVGTVSFVKICLKFRVGIVESCQEVSNVPPRTLRADIAIDRNHR